MVKSRKLPFISADSVRAAVEGMLYKREGENPLIYLTLVDHFLSNPDLPYMENPREYALQHILISIINRELTIQRRIFARDAPDISDTLATAERQIELDGQQQAPDLIGWSLLHYRYVRVDLDVSPARFAQLARLNDRTFRRHQATTIDKRLVEILTHAEWEARTWRRQLRLRSVLPTIEESHFVGRSQVIQQTREILKDVRPPHVFITGARGVGKTALVEMVLRELIDTDSLDNIVWIDTPRSLDHIMNLLHEILHQHDSQFMVKDYTLVNRVAVVLENLMLVAHEIDQLKQLWHNLSGAIVFVTNVAYLQLSSSFRHIVLTALDHDSVVELVGQMRPDLGATLVESYANDIWHGVGGNPFAIKLTVNQVGNLNISKPFIDESVAENIFTASYETLDIDARMMLFMVCLLPVNSTTTTAHLRTIWPDVRMQDSQLIVLLSCGLITAFESGEVALNVNARQFIPVLYDQDRHAASIINQLIGCIQADSSETFPIIEHILFSEWPPIDSEREQEWLEQCFAVGLRRGHYSTWLHIANRIGLEMPEVQLYRATCLRRLGQPVQAREILSQVVGAAGLLGDFDLQGRALVELCGLLRQQGHYTSAQELLAHIRVTSLIAEDIALERSQIMYESGDLRSALAILAQYQHPVSVRHHALLSEIYLAMGDFKRSEDYIQAAISNINDSHFSLGRLHSIRARLSCAKGNEASITLQLFELALALLERERDRFGLARCQTNLAAFLIDQKDNLDTARRLLKQAESEQMLLQDAVGLLSTRHNLDALDRKTI